MDARHPILRIIDAYGSALGISDTTIGHRVFNDSKRVRLLRDGGDITFGRYARAVQWLSDHWPDSAEWPRDIERPAPRMDAAE